MKRYSKKQTLISMYVIIILLLLSVILQFPKNNYLIFEENNLLPNTTSRTFWVRFNQSSKAYCESSNGTKVTLTVDSSITAYGTRPYNRNNSSLNVKLLDNFNCETSIDQITIIQASNKNLIEYIPYDAEINNYKINELVGLNGQKIEFSSPIDLSSLSANIVGMVTNQDNIYALKINNELFFTKNCVKCDLNLPIDGLISKRLVQYNKNIPPNVNYLAEVNLINKNILKPRADKNSFNFASVNNLEQLNQQLSEGKNLIYRLNFETKDKSYSNLSKNIEFVTNNWNNPKMDFLFLTSELTTETIQKINDSTTKQLIYIVADDSIENLQFITAKNNIIIL